MHAHAAEIGRTTIISARWADWCLRELEQRGATPEQADRLVRAYAQMRAENPNTAFSDILNFLPKPTRDQTAVD